MYLLHRTFAIMIAITRKELFQFFSSLTGFITIVLFLLVNGLFLFVLKDSNIFDFGYATLDKFFKLAPWVFLFLIPAITMRTLSDEYRTGTIEILQTKPLTRWQIILGKYLAIVLVLLVALLPTLIYILTINSLSASGIDSGSIAGSYIGLVFLAFAFAAIGLWCSGFTTNPIIAFLISATACLVLYFGFNAISQLPAFQGKADYYLEMFGIDFHYRSISRGVVDTRDIVYFASVIFFFIFITGNSGTFNGKARRFKWLPVLLGLILVNMAGSKFHGRFDLTNEKRFTVSAPVKKLLSSIDGQVQIDIFLKGDFPSGFIKLAASAEDILDEFREIAGNKLRYQFISADDEMPGTSIRYADTLLGMGIQPINVNFQIKAGEQTLYVYPVALVHYNDAIQPVELYPGNKILIGPAELNSAEAMMEYRFASAIQRLVSPVKPIVGYATGNGEPGMPIINDLFSLLNKNYKLFTLNISKEPLIPDTFKALVITKPTIPFTESDKLKIDQYIMRGGKVLWLIDRLEAEMDSLRIKNQVVAYDRNLNIEDLLFRYGVRINPDLVMDLQCDFLPAVVSGNGQMQFVHWNYFPLFESSLDHPINKNLGLVAGRFVNSIDTVKADNVKKTILLQSSAHSRRISTPALVSFEENRNVPEDTLFNKKDLPVAVLLEGKFTSLYANRISQAEIDSMKNYGITFRRSSPDSTSMIVVSDGDIGMNGVLKEEPLPMGMNEFTIGSQYEYQFANHDFIQNCLDYLVNNSGLGEAKAKDYVLRLLDPVKIKEDRTKWQLINIGFPVLLIGIFSFIFQWWRKRKYTHAT